LSKINISHNCKEKDLEIHAVEPENKSSRLIILMMYDFFWIIPRRTYLPMNMEQTECSETSVYKIQTPGNYPEESIQHLQHGERLKSRIIILSRYRTPTGDFDQFVRSLGDDIKCLCKPKKDFSICGDIKTDYLIEEQ
jgi:hypothetical protein